MKMFCRFGIDSAPEWSILVIVSSSSGKQRNRQRDLREEGSTAARPEGEEVDVRDRESCEIGSDKLSKFSPFGSGTISRQLQQRLSSFSNSFSDTG